MRLPLAALAAALLATPAYAATPEQVVRGFLEHVRSGHHPDRVTDYFAPEVAAHQLTAEGEETIVRTPREYADHVRDFLRTYGKYDFAITELIAQGDRVYARWRQQGRHLASIAGEAATGEPITEIGAGVYRVQAGRIVEYWIQTDRKGLELQLARLARR